MTQLLWFRNDLRLADNPALTAAAGSGELRHACTLLTPQQWREHDWSPARTDLLLRSLEPLGRELGERGIRLHLLTLARFDDSAEALLTLCRKHGIERIHANEEYAFNERERDRQLKQALGEQSITLSIYRDQTVVPVTELLTGSGTPYTVFTPFSRSWWRWVEQNPPQLHPVPQAQGEPVTADEVPALPEWRSTVAHWVGAGEEGAHKALEAFIDERIDQYREERDFPAKPATSIISPYLALGILSPRQCLVRASEALAGQSDSSSARTWLNEIAWRDFYIQLMYHYPRLSKHRAFKPGTEQLRWNPPGEAFEAWKQGRTGIPIVDAAMRQLNATGWMHNRLRMITAMFLSKNLFIDWREGERYFMQSLVDGYLPSNNGGWQWSASTGTDAAPYFRIFNPVTQSERFDPDGAFIRRWVPEIAHLQGKALFNPVGSVAGYPAPIVDLKSSRQAAIEAFQALKE